MSLDSQSLIIPADAASTFAAIPTDLKDLGAGGAQQARAAMVVSSVADPATGKATPITSVNRMPVTGAGVKELIVPLTVQAAAYAANNLLGASVPLSALARAAGLSGLIQSVHLFSKSGQKPLVQVALFDAAPSGATVLNDKTNPTWVAADAAKMIDIVQLSDWKNFGTPSWVSATQLALPFLTGAGSADGVAAIQTLSAVTFPTTDDLTLIVRVLQY